MLSFPKNKIEYAMFVGIEQEGPLGNNKNIKTLFVVGSPLVKDTVREFKRRKCRAIYFGAGGRFDYDIINVLETIEALNGNALVTIESPDYDGQLFETICKLTNNTCYWVIPFVFNSKMIQKSKQVLTEMSQHLSIWWQTRILVKIDTGSSVFISQLNNNFVNNYLQGYDKDKFIIQKER